MKWNKHGGSWIEDPTAQSMKKKPYEYRDTGSSSVRAGNPHAKSERAAAAAIACDSDDVCANRHERGAAWWWRL